MKKLLLMLALALGTMGPAQAVETKVFGVMFYADWCHYCQILDTKLDKVRKEFEGTAFKFQRIDMTDDSRLYASFNEAKALGLGRIVRAYGQGTGFMLLVDARTGQVVDQIVARHSESQIKAKIQQALDS